MVPISVIFPDAGITFWDRAHEGSGGVEASQALAEPLEAPVCVAYQHNDAFPGSHPLFAGQLGFNGSKAAMDLIGQPCGLKEVVARMMDELTDALTQTIKDQADGKTTMIEAMINQERGDPFRRDAMKKPVRVAGIDVADMIDQVI